MLTTVKYTKEMSYKHNIIKERFIVEITKGDDVTKATFEIDSNATNVFGILLTGSDDNSLFYRGSQKIQLNDQELFPEDFESRLLMSGMGVSPNNRVVEIGQVSRGNGKLEVWYKDQKSPKALAFKPYTVNIYVFSKVEP